MSLITKYFGGSDPMNEYNKTYYDRKDSNNGVQG